MDHPTQKQIKFLNQKLQVLDEEKCLLQRRIEDYVTQVKQDTMLWIEGHHEKDLSLIRSMIDTATVKLVDTYDVFAVDIGHASAQFAEEDHTIPSDLPKTGIPISNNETKGKAI
ncbi:uncharacterized protein LOC131943557 [Physella acuta]|uniref:uncharacterized protein LOC131943557 n=1 Tax=Physella acuta TaxID=109671 RepID=UPI0027DD1B4B|nr:uncharacterized protein LOC131943557 [Physella acuta]